MFQFLCCYCNRFVSFANNKGNIDGQVINKYEEKELPKIPALWYPSKRSVFLC